MGAFLHRLTRSLSENSALIAAKFALGRAFLPKVLYKAYTSMFIGQLGTAPTRVRVARLKG